MVAELQEQTASVIALESSAADTDAHTGAAAAEVAQAAVRDVMIADPASRNGRGLPVPCDGTPVLGSTCRGYQGC